MCSLHSDRELPFRDDTGARVAAEFLRHKDLNCSQVKQVNSQSSRRS